MNDRGKFCSQTKPISICQDMSIHRIAEYGQQRIHSQLNQYHFILQRSLCGEGLRHHLSSGRIFLTRWVLLVPLPSLVSSISVLCATTSFRSSTAWLCGWYQFYARWCSSAHCKSNDAAAEGAFWKC
ncbi:uncharacterized protein TNCV_3295091 [Trichonephila clavipes]|uniref:Uncharacterized protein n=1 Tax=Trichonephila clavipes TaxID=2585209 RepID=A0A8X6T1D1_TRICX|nr:uncharacterized protein TNCV_3295091 [Trichonephila clavipes]